MQVKIADYLKYREVLFINVRKSLGTLRTHLPNYGNCLWHPLSSSLFTIPQFMLKSKQKPFEYSIGEALQWAWDTPRKSIQIDTNILRYFLPFCDP